ncbi:MAG: peptide ABC transporter substrate-binding protein [Candidatus Schekmanbacteria bacterium]|nr:peptide ABC transporter substrate-binding protein [Candidatus Schekmanbacteria bacterium]
MSGGHGRRPLQVCALAAALLLLAAASCGGDPATSRQPPPAQSDGQTARTNRLIIGLQQEPDKLNAALNAMVYTTYVTAPIYGYFVTIDEQMNLVPDVIERIPTLENGDISADYLTYTYHLRRGLRWHDGAPFTAADVLFSTAVMLDPRHEIESRSGFDKIDTVKAPDDYTVVFKLKEPFAPFVMDTFLNEPIMPRHLLADQIGDDFGKSAFHRAPVGLGPYRFKTWATGSHVTLQRNPDYFRGAPAIEEVTFRFIPDANALLVALKAGEIDGFDNARPDHLEQLRKLENVAVSITPLLMWEHLDFNVESPLLRDVRVRRAIQLGIDRAQISREIYGAVYPVAAGDISPRLSWYNAAVEQLVRYDPAAAARLLDEAGWKRGADGVRTSDGARMTVRLSTTAGNPSRELVEQVLQQQLGSLGIEIAIENHNATALFAPHESGGVLKQGRFDLALYAWVYFPDPDRKNLYHSTNIPPPHGQNHSRYASSRMDELLDRGIRAVAFAERKAIYDDVQVLVATDVPMTPIVWRSDIDPMTARLEGFKPNPTQVGDTWNIHEWRLRPR